MRKKLILAVFWGLVIFLITGCEDEKLSREIDKKFRGKWETQTIRSNGNNYYFPMTINNIPVYTRGWSVEARTIKLYHNGVVVQTYNDVYSEFYSDGSGYFLLIENDARTSVEMEVNGNSAEISVGLVFDTCNKVNKFSWQ